MPEHIHLLIGEPQQKNPSTVMQVLKLGFARRVLEEAKRKRNPEQHRVVDRRYIAAAPPPSFLDTLSSTP
jgi:REP element-mobilizing transposase RayT